MLYLLLLCFVSFNFCAHVSLPQKAIDWSVILHFLVIHMWICLLLIVVFVLFEITVSNSTS